MDLVSNEVRSFSWTENSRTFKDTFPIFQGLHSVQKKSVDPMSSLGDVRWRRRAQIKQLAWPMAER